MAEKLSEFDLARIERYNLENRQRKRARHLKRCKEAPAYRRVPSPSYWAEDTIDALVAEIRRIIAVVENR
jgi:hypothetical protein